MRTPIGWHNLTHDRPRTAVAVAGVMFTLIIIFMQIGFIKLVAVTSTILLDKLDYDVIILSKDYAFLSEAQGFPRQLLDLAGSVPGVREAVPLYLADGTWRNGANPEAETREQRRMTLVMGVRLHDRVFRRRDTFDPQVIERHRDDLARPDTLLVDQQSRPEFLPIDVGRTVDLGVTRGTIVGQFSLGSGFSADSSMIVSAENFERIFGTGRLRRVSLGLVRVEPGSDPVEVVRALRAALPESQVQVLTRPEMEGRETRFWLFHKSIGIMFLLGVAVACVVGAVVVFQVLSSDIAEHFAEYATLKAIGRTGFDVARVVVSQALLLATAAYVPALAAAFVLYSVTSRVVLLPLRMDAPIALTVLVLANLICALSAVVSIRKLETADPADLF